MGFFSMILIVAFAVRLNMSYPAYYNHHQRDGNKGSRITAAPTSFRRPYPRPQQMNRPIFSAGTRPPYYGNPTLPPKKNEKNPSRSVYDLRSLITTTSSDLIGSLDTSKQEPIVTESVVSDQDSTNKGVLADFKDSVVKLEEVLVCKFVMFNITAFQVPDFVSNLATLIENMSEELVTTLQEDMKMHRDRHREMKEIELSKIKLFQEYVDASVKHHEELLTYLKIK